MEIQVFWHTIAHKARQLTLKYAVFNDLDRWLDIRYAVWSGIEWNESVIQQIHLAKLDNVSRNMLWSSYANTRGSALNNCSKLEFNCFRWVKVERNCWVRSDLDFKCVADWCQSLITEYRYLEFGLWYVCAYGRVTDKWFSPCSVWYRLHFVGEWTNMTKSFIN